MKQKPMSQEHKDKISLANKGRKRPDMVGKKPTHSFQKGYTPWNKGKTGLTKGNRNKGKNHHSWKGGVTLNLKGERENTSIYRKKVYETLKKKHPGIFTRYTDKRRVVKIGNGGSHTTHEWDLLKIQYNWKCPSCKKSE